MAKRKKEVIPKRGEVYLVNFDPTRGAEIKKTRPALILQNDIGNKYSPVTIVAAITSQFTQPLYPTEVLIKSSKGGLTRDCVVLLNQIRTIDNQRLLERLGTLKEETMRQVDKAIEISLGLVKI